MNKNEKLEETIGFLKDHRIEGVGDLNTINPMNYVDLSGIAKETKTGIEFPVCFEVKNKTCKHNDFGDVMCDLHKLSEFIKKNEYKEMLVINYYKDNYMAIANPRHGCKLEYRLMPKDTDFETKGEEKEWQWVISMPQEQLYKLNLKTKKYERIK